jgi:hypothetical protein
MRQAEHVTQVSDMKNAHKIWLEILKGRDRPLRIPRGRQKDNIKN